MIECFITRNEHAVTPNLFIPYLRLAICHVNILIEKASIYMKLFSRLRRAGDVYVSKLETSRVREVAMIEIEIFISKASL